MSVWRCVTLYVLKVSCSVYDLTKIAIIMFSDSVHIEEVKLQQKW